MDHVQTGLILAAWVCPWAFGGMLLAASAFRLRGSEVAPVGLAIGLVVEIWAANLLAQIVEAPVAFWIASAMVLVAGIGLQLAQGAWRLPSFRPWTWLALAALVLLFNAIGRGLAIFDDYQNLPTVSLMAAGDVPPHFALDPSIRFGYHYFLLLFAAQLMRLGNILPWSALDLARAVMLGLPLVLAGHWAYRLTRRRLAAGLSAAVLAFAGGTRWLLLLLPSSWVARISDEVTLIGSASTSAASLSEAMISAWKIDGAGPMPFPFAFYSGINQPYIMLYTGIAGSGVLILLVLLLTANRWRDWAAPVLSVTLMAALAIANEVAFLLLGLGIVLASLVAAAVGPRKASVRGAAAWLAIAMGALAVAAVQGGLLTEAMRNAAGQGTAGSSYFDATPSLVWPPAIVSAHLGALSLVRPWQLLLALLEIGPIVIITPAVLTRGWHSIRRGRWLEAGVIASSVGVLGAMFLSFKGPLFTAGPRLLGGWLLVCSLYFVPLVWSWAAKRRDASRLGAVIVGSACCLGGLVLFAVQLLTIQRPVFSTFITQLDASMAERHWNEIEDSALVFDPLVFRAPTVLGRPTRSAPSWYARSSEWEQLRDHGSPLELADAGFTHMYIDGQYWEGLDAAQQQALGGGCVSEIDRIDGVRSETDYRKDFRVLLDIRACE